MCDDVGKRPAKQRRVGWKNHREDLHDPKREDKAGILPGTLAGRQCHEAML
jgi:hypothetical protein